MQITATELKNNLGKYLELAEREDIQVTKNGRNIVTMSSPNKERVKNMQSIFGIVKTDKPISLDEIRYERLTKKLGYKI